MAEPHDADTCTVEECGTCHTCQRDHPTSQHARWALHQTGAEYEARAETAAKAVTDTPVRTTGASRVLPKSEFDAIWTDEVKQYSTMTDEEAAEHRHKMVRAAMCIQVRVQVGARDERLRLENASEERKKALAAIDAKYKPIPEPSAPSKNAASGKPRATPKTNEQKAIEALIASGMTPEMAAVIIARAPKARG
jgi:hypothetical protein